MFCGRGRKWEAKAEHDTEVTGEDECCIYFSGSGFSSIGFSRPTDDLYESGWVKKWRQKVRIVGNERERE